MGWVRPDRKPARHDCKRIRASAERIHAQLRQLYVVTERNFFSFLPDKSNVISFAPPVWNAVIASSTANLMGAALWPVWLQ